MDETGATLSKSAYEAGGITSARARRETSGDTSSPTPPPASAPFQRTHTYRSPLDAAVARPGPLASRLVVCCVKVGGKSTVGPGGSKLAAKMDSHSAGGGSVAGGGVISRVASTLLCSRGAPNTKVPDVAHALPSLPSEKTDDVTVDIAWPRRTIDASISTAPPAASTKLSSALRSGGKSNVPSSLSVRRAPSRQRAADRPP
mmetsp:Transcript_2464/g.8131  ORF Transcript_2464/g.8131 Transcript_2464/m.8131 type:complete len:202 (+) Transcript_2464:226-831(+)